MKHVLRAQLVVELVDSLDADAEARGASKPRRSR
jgi:hypothetical protein